MARKAMSATEIEWRSLAALRALDGRHWKEVAGEFQGAYGEFATWILLFDDSDLAEAHDAYRTAMAPFHAAADDLAFTVAYMRLTETEEITLAFLSGRDAVRQPLDPGALPPPHAVPRRTTVFRSQDSRRPGP